MARLPDRTSLGRSPVPRNTRQIPDYSGLVNAAARNAEQVGKAEQIASDSIDRVAQEQYRIAQRQSAVENAKALAAYKLKSDEAFQAAIEGGDPSDPEEGKQFFSGRDADLRDVLDNYQGTPEGRARLEAALAGVSTAYKQKYSQNAIISREATLTKANRDTLDTGSAEVYENPAAFNDVLKSSLEQIDFNNHGLDRKTDISQREEAGRILATAAIRGRLDRRNWDDAEAMVNDPKMQDLLGSETTLRVKGEIERGRASGAEYLKDLNEALAIAQVGNGGRPVGDAQRAEIAKMVLNKKYGGSATKPNYVNFAPQGAEGDAAKWQSVDLNSPEGRQKAIQLTTQGYVRASLALQASSTEGFPGGNAAKAKFNQGVVAARQTIAGIGRIKEQIASGGAKILSFTGAASKAIDSVVYQLQAAAQTFGGYAEMDGQRVDDKTLIGKMANDPSYFEGFSGPVGKIAQASAAFRSNVLGLAYALARAEDPGGRLSERDVQNQIDRIAASSGSPAQINASLDELDYKTRQGLIFMAEQNNAMNLLPPELRSMPKAPGLPEKTKPPRGVPSDAVPVEKNGVLFWYSHIEKKWYTDAPATKSETK